MAGPLMALLPAAISAVGSLISGNSATKAAEKQNRQQARAIAQQNEYTDEYNKNKIQWLVKDAKAAGLHPLAALGSSAAGSFASPAAAFGGQPVSGSAVGDAMQNFAAGMPPPVDPLTVELQKAQIANVNASTANLLSEAQSRTLIKNGANAAQGQQAHEAGIFDFTAKNPGAAQRAQDDFGDIWEQFFGTLNIKDITVNRDRMGPLSREFYDFWLSKTGGK